MMHATKTGLATRFRWGIALGLLLVALPASAKTELALLPGRMVGRVHEFTMPKGKSLAEVAAWYGVHPVRITKPSREALRDGVIAGRTLKVDQRHIMPSFGSHVSGIVVNIPEAHLYLVDKGRILKDYPVGVSQKDWQAPIGLTRIVSKVKHPTWIVPESIQKEMEEKGQEVKKEVPAGPQNPLGTRWIGFSSGSFGIHGTLYPTSIKRYASHGCIRMTNAQVEDLFERVKVGMPVRIAYQPIMVAAAGEQIWMAVYPDIYEIHPDYRSTVNTLLRKAGVTNRVDWSKINRLLQVRDGIPQDVALSTAKPSPKPTAVPSPTAMPSPVPTVEPSAAPSPEPTGVPSLPPGESPSPSDVPAPDGSADPIEPPSPPVEARVSPTPQPADSAGVEAATPL